MTYAHPLFLQFLQLLTGGVCFQGACSRYHCFLFAAFLLLYIGFFHVIKLHTYDNSKVSNFHPLSLAVGILPTVLVLLCCILSKVAYNYILRGPQSAPKGSKRHILLSLRLHEVFYTAFSIPFSFFGVFAVVVQSLLMLGSLTAYLVVGELSFIQTVLTAFSAASASFSQVAGPVHDADSANCVGSQKLLSSRVFWLTSFSTLGALIPSLYHIPPLFSVIFALGVLSPPSVLFYTCTEYVFRCIGVIQSAPFSQSMITAGIRLFIALVFLLPSSALVFSESHFIRFTASLLSSVFRIDADGVSHALQAPLTRVMSSAILASFVVALGGYFVSTPSNGVIPVMVPFVIALCIAFGTIITGIGLSFLIAPRADDLGSLLGVLQCISLVLLATGFIPRFVSLIYRVVDFIRLRRRKRRHKGRSATWDQTYQRLTDVARLLGSFFRYSSYFATYFKVWLACTCRAITQDTESVFSCILFSFSLLHIYQLSLLRPGTIATSSLATLALILLRKVSIEECDTVLCLMPWVVLVVHKFLLLVQFCISYMFTPLITSPERAFSNPLQLLVNTLLPIVLVFNIAICAASAVLPFTPGPVMGTALFWPFFAHPMIFWTEQIHLQKKTRRISWRDWVPRRKIGRLLSYLETDGENSDDCQSSALTGRSAGAVRAVTPLRGFPAEESEGITRREKGYAKLLQSLVYDAENAGAAYYSVMSTEAVARLPRLFDSCVLPSPCPGGFVLLCIDHMALIVHIVERGRGYIVAQTRGTEIRGTLCARHELHALISAQRDDQLSTLLGMPLLRCWELSGKVDFPLYSVSYLKLGDALKDAEMRRLLISSIILGLYDSFSCSDISALCIRAAGDVGALTPVTSSRRQVVRQLLFVVFSRRPCGSSWSTPLDPDFCDDEGEDGSFLQQALIALGYTKSPVPLNPPESVGSGVFFSRFCRLFWDLPLPPDISRGSLSHVFFLALAFRASCWVRSILLAGAKPEADCALVSSLPQRFFLLYQGVSATIEPGGDRWNWRQFDDALGSHQFIQLVNSGVRHSVPLFLALISENCTSSELLSEDGSSVLLTNILGQCEDAVSEPELTAPWYDAISRRSHRVFSVRREMQNALIAHEDPILSGGDLNADDEAAQYLVVSAIWTVQSVAIMTLNSCCVRGLWASQIYELLALKQQDPERASTQQLSPVLRNLLTSSLDYPFGNLRYVSPFSTFTYSTEDALKVKEPTS